MESDAMAPIAISIASDDYDRVRALRSGRVGVEGCAVTYLTLPPSETFPRLFNHQEFDVSEMSLSTYMLARSKGPWPYRAIPVLLSRVFPHCSIWIRTDRGISGPEDLKGRAIGAPSYHFTRLLCVRGMLSDEYGVRPADIRWRLGGYNQPQRRNYVGAEPPQGVDVETIDADKSLNGMLESGELDAVIGARDPLAFLQRAPHIDRLFPDFRPLEQAYYRKTGIFPVMHVIGVRESLIEAHPWLARNLMKAFEESKAACLPSLAELDALTVTLPWLVAEYEDTVRLMGEDFWPYGIAPNRPTLEAEIRWSFEQGLSGRRWDVEELFVESTHDW